jgi:hypothetical protein
MNGKNMLIMSQPRRSRSPFERGPLPRRTNTLQCRMDSYRFGLKGYEDWRRLQRQTDDRMKVIRQPNDKLPHTNPHSGQRAFVSHCPDPGQ